MEGGRWKSSANSGTLDAKPSAHPPKKKSNIGRVHFTHNASYEHLQPYAWSQPEGRKRVKQSSGKRGLVMRWKIAVATRTPRGRRLRRSPGGRRRARAAAVTTAPSVAPATAAGGRASSGAFSASAFRIKERPPAAHASLRSPSAAGVGPTLVQIAFRLQYFHAIQHYQKEKKTFGSCFHLEGAFE